MSAYWIWARRFWGLAGVWLGAVAVARADSTWLYAVQLSASAQASPASITLSWPQDPYGVNSYSVYRKGEGIQTQDRG